MSQTKTLILAPVYSLNELYDGESEMDVVTLSLILFVIAFFVVVVLLGLGLYAVKQWEKVAVLRFGRIVKIADTGLNLKIPFIDTIRRIDMRMQTIDLRGQNAITRDNISVGLDAVVFVRVENPEKVLVNVYDYEEAVSKYAQTSIRDIVGRYSLDELLQNRETIAKSLKEVVDELAKDWGVDITKAELQDLALPEDMKRAFAVQAESERESRAIKIKAQAELESSITLKEAAKNLEDPNAMQLRILETIKQVSKDQSNTIIVALPLETLKAGNLSDIASLSAIRPKFLQGNLAKPTAKKEESS